MSEQKLCWRCREWLINKFGANYYVAPSNHGKRKIHAHK
jgi:hypothetical protein